jgi:hypothetical protein
MNFLADVAAEQGVAYVPDLAACCRACAQWEIGRSLFQLAVHRNAQVSV